MFSVFESSTVPYAGCPDAHLPRIEKPRRETSWTCGTVKNKLPFPLLSPEFHSTMQEFRVTEERKFAILFAATILTARKLIDMDPNKPNMAKGYFMDSAIDDYRTSAKLFTKFWRRPHGPQPLVLHPADEHR